MAIIFNTRILLEQIWVVWKSTTTNLTSQTISPNCSVKFFKNDLAQKIASKSKYFVFVNQKLNFFDLMI